MKVPPHSQRAEAAVLSAVVLARDDTLLDEVRSVLSAEQFYADKNKHIFQAICDLQDADDKIDVETIVNRLQVAGKWPMVGSQYLMEIIDATPSVANVEAHARIVRDFYRQRQLIVTTQRATAEACTLEGADHERLQTLLEQTEEDVADLAHEHQRARMRSLSDVLIQVDRDISEAYNHKNVVKGVPTGLKLLDNTTTGMHDGDLTVVAGRPGMGKSGLATSVARKVAQAGYLVPFFSLEMPAEQIGLRLVAMESGIDIKTLRTGYLDASAWSKVTNALAALSALPIYIDDSADSSLFDIRAGVKRLIRQLGAGKLKNCQQGRVGLVIIDYLQLINHRVRDRSREQEVAAITRELKKQAKQFDLPYWILAQLNREPEKRPDHRPRLSDLRESGAVEQDADNVIFVHQPSQYMEDDPALRGIAELLVAKQRNGPTGKLTVAYERKCTRFENLESEYDYEADNEEFEQGTLGGLDG